MSCRYVDLGNGASAFLCSRNTRKAKPCQYCKVRDGELLCDEELRGARAGKTCDGVMCRSCAYAIPGADDRHLCPPHRRERDKKEAEAAAWLAELVAVELDEPKREAAEPVQVMPLMPPPPVQLRETGGRCPWPQCPKPPWALLPFCKVHWTTLPIRVREMFDFGGNREAALAEAGAWIASMTQQQSGTWNRAVNKVREKDRQR